jgi:hypothetical protein
MVRPEKVAVQLCSVVGLHHSGAPPGGNRSPKVAFPRGHLRHENSWPPGCFSVHRRHADLLRGLPIASESVRQRQSNPRKVYPIDPGLIDLFDRRGQRQLGQWLETVVALELWRRGCSLSYALTPEREEVDFVAREPDGSRHLCAGAAPAGKPARGQRRRTARPGGTGSPPIAGSIDPPACG